MSALRVERVAGPGVGALIPEWRKLAVQSGNPFVTPEWVLSWAEAYSAAERVELATVSDDEELCAVVALEVSPGRLGRATTRFAAAALGDHFEPLISRGHPRAAEALALLGREVMRLDRLGTCSLDFLDAGSGWPLDPLGGDASRVRASVLREAEMPFIDLVPFAGFEEFLASLSRNLRSQLRRYERRLSDAYSVEASMTRDGTSLDQDLDEFFRLHDLRWNERGGSSSRGPAVRDFHRRFSARALEQGWLRLWTLRVESIPVAAWYGVSIGDRYSYFLAGFDPSWAAERVGWVLLARTIEHAVEEGSTIYDMLLGDEDYKQRLATGRRSTRSLSFTRRGTPRAAVAGAEERARRVAARLDPERRRRIRTALAPVLDRLPSSRAR